jgi:hypothetical protein
MTPSAASSGRCPKGHRLRLDASGGRNGVAVATTELPLGQ